MEGISQKHFLCVCKCAYAHNVNWNYLIVRVVQTSPSFTAEKSEAMTLSRRNVAFIFFLLQSPFYILTSATVAMKTAESRKKIKTKPPGCLHMHVPKSRTALGLSFAKSFFIMGWTSNYVKTTSFSFPLPPFPHSLPKCALRSSQQSLLFKLKFPGSSWYLCFFGIS